MPRFSSVGSSSTIKTPTSSPASPPDYFTSLDALRTYSSTPRSTDRHTAPLIEYDTTRKEDSEKGKMTVCHDYKGGYCEDTGSRGYTFQWWHLTSSFIYFSHHRVSLPPADWIRAAHRHGTKIFGTLIFEHASTSATDSILSLLLAERLQGLSEEGSKAFATFDTGIADILVDLALERGFEGYLINVETGLGFEAVGDDGRKEIRGRAECAAALKGWLEYLANETRRRIKGGETMWYDGVTYEGYSNRWQNKLSAQNEPFFASCDSIFLNYFWRPQQLAETVNRVDALVDKGRGDVYVGLDVFGRGQLGGGGFDSWRALDCLQDASQRSIGAYSSTLTLPSRSPTLSNSLSTSQSTPSPQLSCALFAPGWTVESEHLQHDLSTRQGYQKWWADESYLWNGTKATKNVQKERVRWERERKEERGLQRARELAHALSIGVGSRRLVPFDYNAPLPASSASFRPIKAYRPSPRPPPAPHDTFYTNFATGSGHGFWIEGVQVVAPNIGWTDVDFAFPPPVLYYDFPTQGTELTFEEEDAWLGAASLLLKILISQGKDTLDIPLFTTAISVETGRYYKAEVIWKRVNGDLNVGISLGDSGTLLAESSLTVELTKGWMSTTAIIQLAEATSFTPKFIDSLGIRLSSTTPSNWSPPSLLLASLSVVSTYIEYLPIPVVANLVYDRPNQSLTWKISHRFPDSTSLSTVARPVVPAKASWPVFISYALYWLEKGVVDVQRAVFLGVESALRRQDLVDRGAGRYVVRGMREDGSLVSWQEAAVCSID